MDLKKLRKAKSYKTGFNAWSLDELDLSSNFIENAQLLESLNNLKRLDLRNNTRDMISPFNQGGPVCLINDYGNCGDFTVSNKILSYCHFPKEHWRYLKTNNMLERVMKEIRRRTRVVGSFPDGNSALMLTSARLRHISGTKWGTRKYMSMERNQEFNLEEEFEIA